MLIRDRFQIVKKIGLRSFGKIYLAIDKQNGDRPVALKAEDLNSRYPMLVQEIKGLQNLDSKGIP